MKAERKVGKALDEMKKQDGGDAAKARSHAVTELPPTLAETGIERTQSHRWQAEGGGSLLGYVGSSRMGSTVPHNRALAYHSVYKPSECEGQCVRQALTGSLTGDSSVSL